MPTVAKSPTTPMATERSRELVGAGGVNAFIVGQAPADDGAVLLYQVFVNCETGTKDRRALVALPLHEIPMMRRLQQMHGGSCDIVGGWVPGLSQVRSLTEYEIREEYRRLFGDPEAHPPEFGRYVIPTGDGSTSRDLAVEVYGKGADCRLIKVMGELYTKWVQLCQRCQAERKRATADEIKEIVDAVEPNAVAGIDLLPPMPKPISQPDADYGEGIAPDQDDLARLGTLAEFLIGKKVPDRVAIAYAKQAQQTPPLVAFTEAQWKLILPKKDTATLRKQLNDLRGEFESLTQAPAATP